MGVYLYYLPGTNKATLDRETVQKFGLGDVLRDCLETKTTFQRRLIVNQVHANGPGEVRSGAILFAEPPDGLDVTHRVDYCPAEQEWVECGTYWMGWDKTRPPRPEFLARTPLITGYETVLGDGRAWICPTIRKGGRSPNIPRTMGIDTAGEFVMKVLPSYDWAWDLSAEIFDRVFGAQSMAWADAFRLAVSALGLNYRIGPHEASQLGLITTENFQRVAEAAIDWDVVKELLVDDSEDESVKKKDESAAEPVSSTLGLQDGSQITTPVAATSI